MKPQAPHCARAKGFSLIELLVSMVIGLVVTLAITSVLSRSEGSKRTSVSLNDVNQTGAYTTYVLDRVIRSAGSGFAQNWSDVFGCRLDVSQGSTHILPGTIPTASAFANYTLPSRLIPVVIAKGMADTAGIGAEVRGDVLAVMEGSAGVGELSQNVITGSVTASALRLDNILGYRVGDVMLLSDPGVAGDCMMQQVSAVSGDTLTLGGTYFGASGTNVNLSAYGASTIALQMGNAASNPPIMQLYGVGQNRTLFSYDLLQVPASGVDVPIADGVIEMRALYGLDTDGNGTLDSWMDPIAGSGYEAAVLTNGSAVSRTRIRQIIAIRLGLILRTSLQERAPTSVTNPEGYVLPANTTLTLFGDLGTTLQQTRVLSGTELSYRYRTVELTIPLRNVMLAL